MRPAPKPETSKPDVDPPCATNSSGAPAADRVTQPAEPSLVVHDNAVEKVAPAPTVKVVGLAVMLPGSGGTPVTTIESSNCVRAASA